MSDSMEENRRDIRKWLAFLVMSFLGFFNIFTMRINISVAIVAMAKSGKQLFLAFSMNAVCSVFIPGLVLS